MAVSLGDDNHGDLAPPAKRHCLDLDSDLESSSDCNSVNDVSDVADVEMDDDLPSGEDNLAEADAVAF